LQRWGLKFHFISVITDDDKAMKNGKLIISEHYATRMLDGQMSSAICQRVDCAGPWSGSHGVLKGVLFVKAVDGDFAQ
jgi:hypothetical protein